MWVISEEMQFEMDSEGEQSVDNSMRWKRSISGENSKPSLAHAIDNLPNKSCLMLRGSRIWHLKICMLGYWVFQAD